MALLIFLIVFMTITFGVPFVLSTFLPTAYAMLGSFGVSLVSGIVLFLILGKIGKDAQATS